MWFTDFSSPGRVGGIPRHGRVEVCCRSTDRLLPMLVVTSRAPPWQHPGWDLVQTVEFVWWQDSRRTWRSVSTMTASVLFAFAASLALVRVEQKKIKATIFWPSYIQMQAGCLPYYYNNRHHHPDYHPNYHYSYVDKPSYSQPTGRWK